MGQYKCIDRMISLFFGLQLRKNVESCLLSLSTSSVGPRPCPFFRSRWSRNLGLCLRSRVWELCLSPRQETFRQPLTTRCCYCSSGLGCRVDYYTFHCKRYLGHPGFPASYEFPCDLLLLPRLRFPLDEP